jgi:hypothetical protein
MCQPSRISGNRRPKAIDPEKIMIFNWFLKREKKKVHQKWFITPTGLGKVEPVGRFSPEAFLMEAFLCKMENFKIFPSPSQGLVVMSLPGREMTSPSFSVPILSSAFHRPFSLDSKSAAFYDQNG